MQGNFCSVLCLLSTIVGKKNKENGGKGIVPHLEKKNKGRHYIKELNLRKEHWARVSVPRCAIMCSGFTHGTSNIPAIGTMEYLVLSSQQHL